MCRQNLCVCTVTCIHFAFFNGFFCCSFSLCRSSAQIKPLLSLWNYIQTAESHPNTSTKPNATPSSPPTPALWAVVEEGLTKIVSDPTSLPTRENLSFTPTQPLVVHGALVSQAPALYLAAIRTLLFTPLTRVLLAYLHVVVIFPLVPLNHPCGHPPSTAVIRSLTQMV